MLSHANGTNVTAAKIFGDPNLSGTGGVGVSLHAGRHSDAALMAPVVTVADKNEAAAPPRKGELGNRSVTCCHPLNPCSATSKKKRHLLVHVSAFGV